MATVSEVWLQDHAPFLFRRRSWIVGGLLILVLGALTVPGRVLFVLFVGLPILATFGADPEAQIAGNRYQSGSVHGFEVGMSQEDVMALTQPGYLPCLSFPCFARSGRSEARGTISVSVTTLRHFLYVEFMAFQIENGVVVEIWHTRRPPAIYI